MTSSAKTFDDQQTGINIMLAGLSSQVASLFIFSVMALEYFYRLYKNPQFWNTENSVLYESKLFRTFLGGLALATLTIFTRSVFRVAELSGGFHGSLANNEVSFMILEGAMVTIACACLTLLHPGICFRGLWGNSDFSFRTKKSADPEKTAVSSGDVSQNNVNGVTETVTRSKAVH